LSKYVTLRHDYDVKENSIPFEFTIYVLKKWGVEDEMRHHAAHLFTLGWLL
jgi:hypothetical protein